MDLMTNEEILIEGDYKQITLTTYRIRQEIRLWGQVTLKSIMLEHITSCIYRRTSNPMLLIAGILSVGLAWVTKQESGPLPDASLWLGGFGIALIIVYFMTVKRHLSIASDSAQIILSTKGMTYENIQSFIEKLESAKNGRMQILNKNESIQPR